MEILAEAVRFFAGGRQILQGIDLELRPKEFLGIIGPNGSGKSTFLKCVYRVQKPTTGKIYFNGKKLDEFSYRESALKLAVVAQHNFYNFDFSVLDVVLMGRSPHKKMMERDNAEDYKIARDALRVVGLEEFGERNFSTLSGGEQQRVILARALTQQTECLVLDEPTASVDTCAEQNLFEHFGRRAEHVVAEQGDLHLAVGALFHIVLELHCGDAAGVGIGSEVPELELDCGQGTRRSKRQHHCQCKLLHRLTPECPHRRCLPVVPPRPGPVRPRQGFNPEAAESPDRQHR